MFTYPFPGRPLMLNWFDQELTLADLYHLPMGVALPGAGCNEIEKRPNVARFVRSLQSSNKFLSVNVNRL